MKSLKELPAEAVASIAARSGVNTIDPIAPPPRPQDVCLYRLPQVLARIPVSKSTWFAGIKAGRFPKGRSLGPRTTVWRSDEIDQIVFVPSC